MNPLKCLGLAGAVLALVACAPSSPPAAPPTTAPTSAPAPTAAATDDRGVPTVKDIAKSDEQLQLGKLAILPNDFARPLFLPPGAPPDRLAALQAAFAKTMADPDFRAEAAKANLEINPQTPERLLSEMREFFTTAEPIKAQLKPIVAP